jgi:hypothetical protein
MTEGQSLDDILNDEPEAAVEQAVEQEPAGEPVSVPRDESGRFARKGDDSGSPPQIEEAKPEEPPLDHAAIVAERRRRQEAEQRARALEEQLQAMQNPPEPPPSIWEDEQGWQQQFGSQVVTQAVSQATLNAKLDMSEMMVRQANPDFEDVKAEFLALAEQNPGLVQQALADPHPWNKAYQIAKNHRAMQELGATNLDDLKAKIRAEMMAEMQGQAPLANPIPPTLATERNVGARSGPAWSGPKSIDDLLR